MSGGSKKSRTVGAEAKYDRNHGLSGQKLNMKTVSAESENWRTSLYPVILRTLLFQIMHCVHAIGSGLESVRSETILSEI